MAAVLILIGLFFCYLWASVTWPYKSCKSCEGKGRSWSPTKKYWRDCEDCAGKGRQDRFGKRLWDRWRGE